MRVIHLTHGSGNGLNTACLMTASNMLIGTPWRGEINDCVCTILQNFIVPTNDAMPEEILGEIYGPLVWEILGTRSDNKWVLIKRGLVFADYAVRVFLPIELDADGDQEGRETADALRSLPPIVDSHTAQMARDMAFGEAKKSVVHAMVMDHDVAGRVTFASHAAAYAAIIAAEASEQQGLCCDHIWQQCVNAIRDAAAIGDKRPVECVMTEDDLCEALGGE